MMIFKIFIIKEKMKKFNISNIECTKMIYFFLFCFIKNKNIAIKGFLSVLSVIRPLI